VVEGEVLTSSQSTADTSADPTDNPTNGSGVAEAVLALWFQESRSMLLAASER
jgi:hypothetical protein